MARLPLIQDGEGPEKVRAAFEAANLSLPQIQQADRTARIG
jgi:hypothetical protein